MPPGLASELGPEFLTGPSTSHLRTPSAMSAFGQERKLPMHLAMLRFTRKKIDKEVLFAGGELRTLFTTHLRPF